MVGLGIEWILLTAQRALEKPLKHYVDSYTGQTLSTSNPQPIWNHQWQTWKLPTERPWVTTITSFKLLFAKNLQNVITQSYKNKKQFVLNLNER